MMPIKEMPMRGLVLGLVGALICGGALAAQSPSWVTAWSTSQQAIGDVRITDATVRMIARVTVPGDAVRIRLDNAFGMEPVSIGRAYVGPRIRGAALASGSNRPLTFSGAPAIVIQPGGSVWSDPVALKVLAQQDLAISLHIPGSGVRPSQHTAAAVTSYRSANGSGDVASATLTRSKRDDVVVVVEGVDVQSMDTSARSSHSAIRSPTARAPLDAHDRWEDIVSVRLGLERCLAPPARRIVAG
jgi:hypothetical protein